MPDVDGRHAGHRWLRQPLTDLAELVHLRPGQDSQDDISLVDTAYRQCHLPGRL